MANRQHGITTPRTPRMSSAFSRNAVGNYRLAFHDHSASVAFAADVKKDKAHVPAVKATIMSDADMDKVTAGFSENQVANGNAAYEINHAILGRGNLSDGGCNRLARIGSGC